MNVYTCELHADRSTHSFALEPTAPDLLLEVDFKWLMAGQGCWIDPDRMHQEPGYARERVQAAIGSPCDALRQCALQLQACMTPQIQAS